MSVQVVRLGGRLSEVVGPVVEEATEPGDATPLTGPVREASIPRAPPPPPRITTPSPPRPPPPPPPPQQQQSQPQQQKLQQLQVHLSAPTLTKSQSQVQIHQSHGNWSQLQHQTSEPTQNQTANMGTVLSFSPKDRRASLYPPIGHQHTTDLTLNNLNYEQLNNAKNRENKNIVAVAPAPTNANNHLSTNNNSLQNNNINLNNNDNARIISEKNALEKNLKKHSLFINALSWKRFSTTNNNKKKLDNRNKNMTFRQPLDNIPIGDKNKNIQTPQVKIILI